MAFNKSFKQDANIAAQSGLVDLSGNTGGLELPRGTTAQRPPASAIAVGTTRYNTTLNVLETYTTSGWQKIVPTAFDYLVSYLVVAGGGGGGQNSNIDNGSGGGGAGGFLSASNVTLNPGTTYTVTVGAGGAKETKGGNSSIVYGGTTLVNAIGGGNAGFAGGSGGSGGGSTGDGTAGGAGTAGQGNRGGNNFFRGGGNYTGTGGGGAGSAGGDTSNYLDGSSGGFGSASTITGASVTYAGGGGAHGQQSNGVGRDGGGSPNGGSGTANRGGGGGGYGGSGGSGVVILSIPTVSYTGTVTGNPSVSVSGSNTIVQFNASGSYTA